MGTKNKSGDVKTRRKYRMYTDEDKEKVYMMYAISENVSHVSRELNIPYATVAGWIAEKRSRPPDKFDKFREKKKIDFIEKSSEIIDKGLELLDRQFTTALESQQELEHLIDEIRESPPGEMTLADKKSAIQAIKSAQMQKAKDITTAIGTLYDKRALAKGESTENTTVHIKLPQEVMKYAE